MRNYINFLLGLLQEDIIVFSALYGLDPIWNLGCHHFFPG
jgi:hypothetical protein